MKHRFISFLFAFVYVMCNAQMQYKIYYKINKDAYKFESVFYNVCERGLSISLVVDAEPNDLLLFQRYENKDKKTIASECKVVSEGDYNIIPFDSSKPILLPDRPKGLISNANLHRSGNNNNEGNNTDDDNETFDYLNYSIKNIYLDVEDPGIKGVFIGDFVAVEEWKAEPILETENTLGEVLGTNATFRAPDFIKNNFTESDIEWTFTPPVGTPIKMFGSSVNFSNSGFYCQTTKVFVTAKSYGWKSGEIEFTLKPMPNIELNIASPLCTDAQKNDNELNAKGKIELGETSLNRVFKIRFSNKDNVLLNQFTFDKTTPFQTLDPNESPYTFVIEEDLGNHVYSCAMTIPKINIVYPTPISITDTGFTDIRCFGLKPQLKIAINGNTNNYTLNYGDSSKTLARGQNYSLPLMTQTRVYDFNITDENGCKYEQPLTFRATEPSKLEATMEIDTAVCYKGSANVKITAKGGIPYDIENPYRYAFWPATGTQISAVYTTKGGVAVYPRVSDKNNCTYSFPVTTLSNPKDFKLSVLQHTDNICPKGTTGNITLTSQSTAKNYSYQYSKDGLAYGSDSVFLALGAGTYKLYSKNQNGCLKDTSVKIIQPPFITIKQTALDSVRCFGESNGSITLDITGGSGYKQVWKSNGSAYLPKDKAYSFFHTYDSLPDTKYWFKAVDSLGCRDSIAYSIGTRSHMNHSSYLEKPSCYESSNGKVTVYVSGGKKPYQHSWLGHPELGTKLQVTGLAKGSYILQTIDKLSCIKVDTFVLTAPPALQVQLEGYPLLCKGQTLELDAGSDGGRYDWNSNNGFRATTRKVSLAKAGTYWVQVRDYNNCEGGDTITLQQSDTEYKADFLVATTVAQGDTVVMVNNNISVDSVRWAWNQTNSKPISHSADNTSQQVTFGDLGEQELEMIGYYKGCRDVKKRKILVVSPQERIKSDQSIGIKTSVIKECHLFPNPNDGSFEVVVELQESGVPMAFTLSSTTTGMVLKRLDLKVYPEGKLSFTEDLPEGPYVLHVKVRDEVVALRFLVAYD